MNLLFRLLLLAYPKRFRRTYGLRLLEMYRTAPNGRRGMVRDMLTSGLGARLDEYRDRRHARGRPATRRGETLAAFAQDVRYALRGWRRTPAMSAAVILTLTLAIGAGTAMFGIIRGVLFAPLPYADAGELIRIWEHDVNQGDTRGHISVADFVDYRERNTTLRAMGAFAISGGLTLMSAGEPRRVITEFFTPGVFDLLGVRPFLGRAFTPEDHQGSRSVVVLSYPFWRQTFGADSSAIGKTFTASDNVYTVVGVMPPAFRPLGPAADMWLPWGEARNNGNPFLRRSHPFRVIARLLPGAAVEDARRDLMAIARQLEIEYPDLNTGHLVTVESLEDSIVGEARAPLYMIAAAVGAVLLIACANLANLFLARSLARRGEMAVRAALGAGRGRVIRQLLSESLLYALAGSAGGVLLAGAGVRAVLTIDPNLLPRAEYVTPDLAWFGFALAAAAAAAALFGVAPAVVAARQDLGNALKAGGPQASWSRRVQRLRGGLVVLQLAGAIVVLTGAGLLLRSFDRLQRVDPGFEAEHVAAAEVVLPPARYMPSARVREFIRESEAGLASKQGVLAVGTVSSLPFRDPMAGVPFRIVDRPPQPGAAPEIHILNISGDYLRVMGATLLRGRGFDAGDQRDTPRVALINETMARRFWPGDNPIGSHVMWGPAMVTEGLVWRPDEEAFEIVGVISDMHQEGLDTRPYPALFMNAAQAPWPSFYIVVRTMGDPEDGMASLRSQLRSMDPDLVPWSLTTMEAAVQESVARRRVGVWLLVSFALVAVLIAAVGVYGVMAYNVTQRTREIGIRVALGATPAGVRGLVVRSAVMLAGTAVAAGVAGALAASRVLEGMLFEITPHDPVTFVIVPGVLFAVAVLASYLPASRAATTDPVEVLRAQ